MYIKLYFESEQMAAGSPPPVSGERKGVIIKVSRWRLRAASGPDGRARRGRHAHAEGSAIVPRRDALELSAHLRASIVPSAHFAQICTIPLQAQRSPYGSRELPRLVTQAGRLRREDGAHICSEPLEYGLVGLALLSCNTLLGGQDPTRWGLT